MKKWPILDCKGLKQCLQIEYFKMENNAKTKRFCRIQTKFMHIETKTVTFTLTKN